MQKNSAGLICCVQVQCKAVVCPAQFKTQEFCEMLREICPEIDDSSPAAKISSSRYDSSRRTLLPLLSSRECRCSKILPRVCQIAGLAHGDRDGQQAAGDAPRGGRDASRREPAPQGAGGSAEQAVLRRPHQHPVHISNIHQRRLCENDHALSGGH